MASSSIDAGVSPEVARTSAPREAGVWATHAALLVVQVAFASGAVEGKIAMRPVAEGGGGIEPYALAMLRMIGGAVFFLAVTEIFGLRKKTTLRDHAILAGLSAVGIVLNQTLFLAGLRITSPVSAALLSVTIPVFTAALAVITRLEKPSARTFGGLALALGGVVWLTGVRTVDHGAVLVTLNSLSYSLYLVFGRGVIRRLGAFTVVTWVYVWAAVIFAPIGLGTLIQTAPSITPRGWAFAAFVVAVPTILSYFLNAWALGRSTASLVTVYIYMQPPITAVLAWVQLDQGLSGRMVGAAVLILVGVGIVASRRPSASPATPQLEASSPKLGAPPLP